MALRAWLAVLVTAAAVVLVDQVTKSWVRGALQGGEVKELVGSLQLALTYNRGVAFGLGEGVAPILVTVAVIGLVGTLVGRKVDLDRLSTFGVGLLLGGAVGNLCDRLFRNTGGAVVDFIDLQWWPVFNVADACIVMGAAVLVLGAMRNSKDAP